MRFVLNGAEPDAAGHRRTSSKSLKTKCFFPSRYAAHHSLFRFTHGNEVNVRFNKCVQIVCCAEQVESCGNPEPKAKKKKLEPPFNDLWDFLASGSSLTFNSECMVFRGIFEHKINFVSSWPQQQLFSNSLFCLLFGVPLPLFSCLFFLFCFI